jgi:hypothetical protein
MKFTILPYLIAGASIAHYAVANPLRLIVITSAKEVSPNAGTGLDKPSFHTEHLSLINPNSQSEPGSRRRRRPCHAAANLGDKAFQLSNSFRKWIGLPVIDKDVKDVVGGDVEVLTLTPIKSFGGVGGAGIKEVQVMPYPPHHPHHHDHHGKFHGKHHDRPFWIRVHHALMSLGPWEGRAVAFVLGCGIGVLLRMLFVMLVLSYRMIRGEPELPEYIEVICDDYTDAESILVPPPQYVCDGAKPEFVDAKEDKVEDKDEVKNSEA